MAMGFTQEKRIDFEKAFAPTMCFKRSQLILSLCGSKGWTGYQINFTAPFLNGLLGQPVYMPQPPGYEDPDHPDYVCEVTGSLYGLRKSPRQWSKALHSLLVECGPVQSKFDPALYFKILKSKLICAVAFHVDDLSIVGEESFI